jgi:hypothetical protein
MLPDPSFHETVNPFNLYLARKTSMAHLVALLVFSIIALSNLSVSPVLGQALPTGERFSLVLPGDPFRWEEALNELGQKGWDAIMAQQPAMGGLILHFVIFTRTPAIKVVDYKVVVAEFYATGDATTLETARSQLATQANAYGRNGWTLLQALTGQHAGGKSYIALLLKKPIY